MERRGGLGVEVVVVKGKWVGDVEWVEVVEYEFLRGEEKNEEMGWDWELVSY